MEQALPLRDIHLPEAISWFPPAIGWWCLLLLIILTIWGSWRLFKHATRHTILKAAQQLLVAIKIDPNTSDLQKLQQVSIWLRRVSISASPRQKSAGLIGKAWLNYLDNSVEGSPFSEGIGQCLIDAQFRQSVPDNVDINALIALCETWLTGQKQ